MFSKSTLLNVSRKAREWRFYEHLCLRVQDVHRVNAVVQARGRVWVGFSGPCLRLAPWQRGPLGMVLAASCLPPSPASKCSHATIGTHNPSAAPPHPHPPPLPATPPGQDIRRIVKNDARIINKLHRRVFLDKITHDDVKIYLSFYVEASNRRGGDPSGLRRHAQRDKLAAPLAHPTRQRFSPLHPSHPNP